MADVEKELTSLSVQTSHDPLVRSPCLYINLPQLVLSQHCNRLRTQRAKIKCVLTELMVASLSASSCLCRAIMSLISNSFMIFSFSRSEYCSSAMERASCSESALVKLASSCAVRESLPRETKRGSVIISLTTDKAETWAADPKTSSQSDFDLSYTVNTDHSLMTFLYARLVFPGV